jgi:hypothetical protein
LPFNRQISEMWRVAEVTTNGEKLKYKVKIKNEYYL